MKINKETAVYLSFSQMPGNQGAKVYNIFFEKLSINAVYIPRKSFHPGAVADAIRQLEIKGASLSMPLKQTIIPYLDELSPEAADINSVNTVLNSNGKLIGHNSDAWGFYQVIENLSFKTVCIFGAGGVVPSILWALKKKGVKLEDICVVTRKPEKALSFAQEHQTCSSSFPSFDILINATPSGHMKDDPVVILCSKAKSVIDLNASGVPEGLAQATSEQNIAIISGQQMFMHQFKKQFEIYHGITLDLKEIETFLK